MNSEEQRSSCPGFLDEYGIWNNGFECPSLSGQKRICCGSDSRRYCCTLDSLHTNSFNSLNLQEKSFLLTNQTNISFIEKINLTFLTLPILLTCILIIILLLLFSLIILLIFYRYYKQNKNQQDEYLSTNQTLFVDHFPFSPPHHQLFLKKTNNPQTYHLHQKLKDTLTTSTSSSSARIPSESYFNDWKDFFTTSEQPMNIYPTTSCHSNETNDNQSYLYSNYLFHGKHQRNAVIV
ncbi:unnamed protein product [Rotaria sp. Silwood2]|nr:unnamed protein product [Rotaria sp. Silwood2]CAF2619311.1 unnamed protein product [Rotaria sp. Silwood2]CAF3013663.1 unnamed protein product [Rotaria sp. Silwood2]CAF3871459.1 unnamed protein product [Rotaria sp. Silwood2]CAF3935615.1 unnamed protein product [Rotaria sp. Silwood2]